MGTTAEKLAYLKETKNQIKQALETPYNVMRDYPALIKKYIDNQPTSKVSNGVCTNALDVLIVRVGIDGNSYQGENPSPDNPQEITNVGERGYNLLNVPDEYTVLSTEVVKKVPISLKANHTYTIKIGQINTDNTDVTSVLFRFTYNEVDISNSYANVKLSDLKGTYTPASDIDAVWIYSGNGYAQGAKTNTTYKNLMIYEGIEDKSYEPYTDGIKIKQSGYNIANLDRKTFTLAGVTVTNNGDGSFTFNGTSTNAADLILTKAGALNSNIYQFEDAKYLLKTFVISGDFSNPDNKGIRIICMGRSNDTDNYTMLYNDLKQNIFSKLFTMHPTDTLGRIEMFVNPGITFNNYTIKILLAKTDNINLPYEPYHEPIITPINLQGNILSKVGNIKDILKVNRNGEVEIKKNIGKVVLDGTENWVTLTAQKGDNTSYFYYAKTDMKKASSIICNQFINRAVWSTDVEGIQSIIDNLIRLRINTSRASTVSELKAWLAAQKEAGTPVIVDYELATPQIIKLPSIEPIELWEGTNKFELITNLDTTFEMEYVVNKDYLETQNLLNAVEGENINDYN